MVIRVFRVIMVNIRGWTEQEPNICARTDILFLSFKFRFRCQDIWHTHFWESFRPPYTGSFRLITLTKCLKGHKSLRMLQTSRDADKSDIQKCDGPTNIWHGWVLETLPMMPTWILKHNASQIFFFCYILCDYNTEYLLQKFWTNLTTI